MSNKGSHGNRYNSTDRRLRAISGVSARAVVLNSYKRSARLRGYSWDLTDEQCLLLMKQPCFYCGCAPSNKQSARYGHGLGDFIYSGIDRRDNALGYTAANTVACCQDCNWGKGKKTPESFLRWIIRVYDYSVKRT